MDELLTQLKLWGAAPEEALLRLLGDCSLYEKLLKELAGSMEPDLMQILIDQKEYAHVFLLAHDMKGSAISLSLMPLYEAVSDLVEELRPFYEQDISTSTPAQETRIETTYAHMKQRWEEFCRIADTGETVQHDPARVPSHENDR